MLRRHDGNDLLDVGQDRQWQRANVQRIGQTQTARGGWLRNALDLWNRGAAGYVPRDTHDTT